MLSNIMTGYYTNYTRSLNNALTQVLGFLDFFTHLHEKIHQNNFMHQNFNKIKQK